VTPREGLRGRRGAGVAATGEPAPAPEHGILDEMLEGCQILGFDWRYLYVNDALVRQSHRTRDELLGCTMMEAYPGIEATPVFASLRRCLEEREASDFENEFDFPDGARGWFELRIRPVPAGVFVLSVDVTARKLAELALHEQLDRLESLRAIDLAILGTTDQGLALRTIVQETGKRMSSDAVAVLLLGAHSPLLEVAASDGLRAAEAERLRLRLGEGVVGRAALEQRTATLSDLEAAAGDSVLARLAAEAGFRTLSAAPMVARGRLLGMLVVFHRAALRLAPKEVAFLEALAGQAAMAIASSRSFADLQRLNLDLTLAYETTIEGWSRALDLRDRETEGHTQRVTETTLRLAREVGVAEAELVQIRRGALLHDIGKMGVPDAMLFKPGPLSEEEWAVMRRHPECARELLAPIDFLRPALDIPYCHHEKWDGSGYPRGLAGEGIPLAARLFAVVDVWDALRSDRPYRAGWPEEKVLDYLRAQSGSHFDPAAVEAFLRLQSRGA